MTNRGLKAILRIPKTVTLSESDQPTKDLGVFDGYSQIGEMERPAAEYTRKQETRRLASQVPLKGIYVCGNTQSCHSKLLDNNSQKLLWVSWSSRGIVTLRCLAYTIRVRNIESIGVCIPVSLAIKGMGYTSINQGSKRGELYRWRR